MLQVDVLAWGKKHWSEADLALRESGQRSSHECRRSSDRFFGRGDCVGIRFNVGLYMELERFEEKGVAFVREGLEA